MMEPRIRIDRLWFEFGEDAYYGEESPCGEVNSINGVSAVLNEVGFEKTGFRLEPWCRQCVPGNYYPPLALALVMCGMDELDTFLPGEKEPTGWKYESFSKNFRDDLEINLNDLKHLMRKRHLPLPAVLFPTDQGNTEEALRLSGEEYQKAFAEFAAISDIEHEIDDWKKKNALTVTEKILQEQKVSELESELQKMKVAAIPREPYPELSFDALTTLADLDAELYPNAYDTSLGGELDERLGELLTKGYKPEQAGKILDAIIRKGEHLKVIAERESLPCQSQSEVDSRNRAIKDAQNEIEKINKELYGKVTHPILKKSCANNRQVALIEKVRELMQRELDTTWPDGKRGLKMYVIKKHHTILKAIYGDTIAENMAGKTKPSHLKRLGIKTPLPK